MASLRTLRRLVAVVTATACGTTVLVATAAQASPAGLVVVTAGSGFSSVGFKTVGAVCPRGTAVLGGGASATTTEGAGFKLLVTQAYPDGAGNQFVAAAFEDESGTADSWRITAYAICASPLRGLEYVATPFYSNISGTWAMCSAGKRLVGMGGQVIGGDGEVALAGVFPGGNPPTRSETWVTKDRTGYAGTYQVRATAVCADPIASLEYVVKTVPNTTGVVTWVDCPAGKKVLSSGARLANGSVPVWHGEAKFSTIGVDVTVTLSTLAASQYLDSGQTFTAQAIALCA